MKLILIFILIFCSVACKKDNSAHPLPSGAYKGTFKRSSIAKNSEVSITFSANTFSGGGQELHYPDVCNGTFSTNKDSISFENACFYTAEFDWSYILSGKYKFVLAGDSLIISRGYDTGTFYADSFKLKKF